MPGLAKTTALQDCRPEERGKLGQSFQDDKRMPSRREDRVLPPGGILELFLWSYPDTRQQGRNQVNSIGLGLDYLQHKRERLLSFLVMQVTGKPCGWQELYPCGLGIAQWEECTFSIHESLGSAPIE